MPRGACQSPATRSRQGGVAGHLLLLAVAVGVVAVWNMRGGPQVLNILGPSHRTIGSSPLPGELADLSVGRPGALGGRRTIRVLGHSTYPVMLSVLAYETHALTASVLVGPGEVVDVLVPSGTYTLVSQRRRSLGSHAITGVKQVADPPFPAESRAVHVDALVTVNLGQPLQSQVPFPIR